MTDFSDLDPVIHEKGKLSIVALLAASPQPWTFSDLRNELGMTDGNLITHLRTLEDLGYLSKHKARNPGYRQRARTSYALTAAGHHAFQSYLDTLAALLNLPKPTPPPKNS